MWNNNSEVIYNFFDQSYTFYTEEDSYQAILISEKVSKRSDFEKYLNN